MENECELKRFKACVVYPKVRPFWIYITVSFFKKPSLLLPCVLKILSILNKIKKIKKKKVKLPRKPYEKELLSSYINYLSSIYSVLHHALPACHAKFKEKRSKLIMHIMLLN